MKRTPDKEINAAVLKGTRWLDRNHPNWARTIDLSVLEMSSGNLCILGQCFGGFFMGLRNYTPAKIQQAEQAVQLAWATAHGFYSYNVSDDSYERLALAWAPVVAIRQMKTKVGL